MWPLLILFHLKSAVSSRELFRWVSIAVLFLSDNVYDSQGRMSFCWRLVLGCCHPVVVPGRVNLSLLGS